MSLAGLRGHPGLRVLHYEPADDATAPPGLLPPLRRSLPSGRVHCRQRAALVCKRFAAAACSPELLREVEPQLHLLNDVAVLRSLAAWLARHGRHVRKLSILFDADFREVRESKASAFATCLATAVATGQLVELKAGMYTTVHTEWLAAARSVQRLTLQGFPLHIAPAISRLLALQSLQLKGEPQFAAGAQLPASISRLVLTNDCIEGINMAPEVSRLIFSPELPYTMTNLVPWLLGFAWLSAQLCSAAGSNASLMHSFLACI